jgi:hypothetical protein
MGPDGREKAQGQPRGEQALTMLTSETMSMLAMSMFIPTQTGGPAGSAYTVISGVPAWGAGVSEDGGLSRCLGGGRGRR